MRTMYDSVSVDAIPSGATLVAGYEDGNWPTAPVLRKRKPTPTVVSLTVNGSTPDAAGIDGETGDASNATVARWCKAAIVNHRIPLAYTYLANLRSLIGALKAAGIQPEHVTLWTAHYTNKPHICGRLCLLRYGIGPRWAKRIMATQYLAYPGASPGHYDVSLVRDYWPGIDPAPSPKPAPTPKATPLADDTRTALTLATDHLRGRSQPVAATDQPVLAAALAQIQRVQALK